MSTKAIRELLECVRLGLRPRDEMAADAMAEVEAIEAAAKVLDGCGIKAAWEGDAWIARGEERETLDKAAATLASIAKDTP